jgi:hypothetical protein
MKYNGGLFEGTIMTGYILLNHRGNEIILEEIIIDSIHRKLACYKQKIMNSH